jgi:hypothetical protein
VPAVPIARIPFGSLPGPFRLTNDAGETREEPGHAVAYWKLHLAIGPSGPLSVAPYLIRGTSVDLMVGEQRFALPDETNDVDPIVSGLPKSPRITLDGDTWQVSSEAKPIYRPVRPGIDEESRHEPRPMARARLYAATARHAAKPSSRTSGSAAGGFTKPAARSVS